MFGLQKDELKSFTTTYHTHPPQIKREKGKRKTTICLYKKELFVKTHQH